MRKITNPQGFIEYIINSEEKEIIDIALHNLAVSSGIAHDCMGDKHD